MPKLIRQGVFETNSSSAHSLAIKKGDYTAPTKYQGKEIVVKIDFTSDNFTGEPSRAKKYSNLEDKLAYVYYSLLEHFGAKGADYLYTFKKGSVVHQYIEQSEKYETGYGKFKTYRKVYKGENGELLLPYATMTMSYAGLQLFDKIKKIVLDKTKATDIKLKLPTYYALNVALGVEVLGFNEQWKIFNKYKEHTIKLPFDVKSIEKYEVVEMCLWNYIPVEFPLNLDQILDLDLMERFLLNSNSFVRISTDNGGYPLDHKIAGKKEGEWFSVTDYEAISYIDKNFDLIYNGSLVKPNHTIKKVEYV